MRGEDLFYGVFWVDRGNKVSDYMPPHIQTELLSNGWRIFWTAEPWSVPDIRPRHRGGFF